MDNDAYLDPVAQDRIIAEAVRRGRRRRRRWRLIGTGAVIASAAGAVAIGLALTGGQAAQRVTTVNPAMAPTTTSPAMAPTTTSPAMAPTTTSPAMAPTTTSPVAGSAAPPSSVSPSPGKTLSQPFPCRSGQIRINVIPDGYGMGSAAAQISYVNTSASECVLAGYPGITVSNESARTSVTARPTQPGRYLQNQNLGWSAPSPVAVKLVPGARAVSLMGWDTGASLAPNMVSKCVSGPWRVAITLPSGGGTIVTAGNLGIGLCANLAAEPIQPATYRPSL